MVAKPEVKAWQDTRSPEAKVVGSKPPLQSRMEETVKNSLKSKRNRVHYMAHVSASYNRTLNLNLLLIIRTSPCQSTIKFSLVLALEFLLLFSRSWMSLFNLAYTYLVVFGSKMLVQPGTYLPFYNSLYQFLLNDPSLE